MLPITSTVFAESHILTSDKYNYFLSLHCPAHFKRTAFALLPAVRKKYNIAHINERQTYAHILFVCCLIRRKRITYNDGIYNRISPLPQFFINQKRSFSVIICTCYWQTDVCLCFQAFFSSPYDIIKITIFLLVFTFSSYPPSLKLQS